MKAVFAFCFNEEIESRPWNKHRLQKWLKGTLVWYPGAPLPH